MMSALLKLKCLLWCQAMMQLIYWNYCNSLQKIHQTIKIHWLVRIQKRPLIACHWILFAALHACGVFINDRPDFAKMKIASGDIIILHTCSKNHCCIMYTSWDMECNRHNFCHFGPFFALFPQYWSRKLKFGQNIKDVQRYYPFRDVYHKWRSHDVWFLRYKVQWKVFCHFGPFSVLCPS